MSYISFEGSLIRKGELMTSKAGNKYMFITVARNYRRLNEETKEWEDLASIFQDCTIFGKAAENFEAANPQPGTRLVIHGRLNGQEARSYVNKEGVTVEVPASESVAVEDIGMSFGAWQQPMLPEREGRTSIPKPAQPSQPAKQEESPQDDLFGDLDGDLFADDSSDDDGFDFFDDL